jgi:hypothetical protein
VALRRSLLAHPARRAHHVSAVLARPLKFMNEIGIPLIGSPS